MLFESAPSAAEIDIRPLRDMLDFRAAEDVQRQTWHASDAELVPAHIFAMATHFGGQALGAFEGGTMLGVALAFGAIQADDVHLHSHLVGVLPEHQGKGIGTLLKLAQRQDALERGIHRISWTYDPMQDSNAHFNIARLGGIGRRYLRNLYGETTSPLHGGLPTDRLEVDWVLDSPRVVARLHGASLYAGHDAGSVSVTIPSFSVESEDFNGRQVALSQLVELFANGYVITDFIQQDGGGTYVLQNA
jgi:predicted GNAT superfamily acetyltransferase